MARQGKFRHNVVVTGSDDAGKQVSKDAWNDDLDESGMFGHGSVTTLTVATDTIIPVNDMHKLNGQGASADNLATITNTETAEFDELFLLSGAQTITLINSGNIITLSGGDTVLSTTVPTKLIRIGTSWYEVGKADINTFLDSVFAVQDDGDITKQMLIQLSGADTGFDTTLTFIQTADRAITFFDATDTIVGKATTDVLTNKSYDLGGTGNVLTGSVAEFNTALQSETFSYIGVANAWGAVDQDITATGKWQEGGTDISPIGAQQQWIPAGAWGTVTTNGAEFAELELGTNDIMLQTFNFDTTTSEKIQFWWHPPSAWDAGTITFQTYWTAGSGSGTVIFSLAGTSLTDSDAIDAVIGGTPATTTDTLLTANDMHISPISSAVTINGATKNEPVLLQISRDISDTLGEDAKLVGVKIIYTIDTAITT